MNGPCIRCGREFTRPSNRGMCHACYMAWWSRRKGYGNFESLYIDAEPVRVHVRHLLNNGMSVRLIASTAGVNRKCIQALLYGCRNRGTPPKRQMRKTNADAILAVRIPVEPLTVLPNRALVDATGTKRRIRALVSYGYSYAEMARRVGWTTANLAKLAGDDTVNVTAGTARLIVDLFNELQLTPGTNSRAKKRGKSHGWALPMEWEEDEIDDPAATPQITDPGRVSFDVRYMEMRDFLGLNDYEIARRMGVSLESLERQKFRYGIYTNARKEAS